VCVYMYPSNDTGCMFRVNMGVYMYTEIGVSGTFRVAVGVCVYRDRHWRYVQSDRGCIRRLTLELFTVKHKTNSSDNHLCFS